MSIPATPWKVLEQGDANQYALITSGQKWVISLGVNGEHSVEQQKEITDFILKAVNHHQELLEALDRLQVKLCCTNDTYEGSIVFDQIEELILKAK